MATRGHVSQGYRDVRPCLPSGKPAYSPSPDIAVFLPPSGREKNIPDRSSFQIAESITST